MLQPFSHIPGIFEFSIRYCGRGSEAISLKRFMVKVAVENFKKIYRASRSDRNRPRGIKKSDFELSHILFWKFFPALKVQNPISTHLEAYCILVSVSE